jgi:hypothetical protein
LASLRHPAKMVRVKAVRVQFSGSPRPEYQGTSTGFWMVTPLVANTLMVIRRYSKIRKGFNEKLCYCRINRQR